MAAVNTSVWDQQELYSRFNQQTELVKKIIQLFINQVPQRVDQLRQFMLQQDCEGAAFQAHSIKGACGSIAAPALQQLCHQINELADQGKGAELPTLVESLDYEASELLARLHSYNH